MQKRAFGLFAYLMLPAGLALAAAFASALAVGLGAAYDVSLRQSEEDLRAFSLSAAALVQDEWARYAENAPDSFHTTEDCRNEAFARIDALFKRVAGFTRDFRISLVDSAGAVVADSDSPDPAAMESHRGREEVARALKGESAAAIRRSTVSGDELLYFASPLELSGMTCALRLSVPLRLNVFASSGARLKMTATFAALFALLLAASLLVSARISRAVKGLSLAASEYAGGNFAHRASVSSPRELARLKGSLEGMARQIQQSMAAIARSRDDFEAVFSGSAEGLIFFDSDMTVLAFNEAAMRFFAADAKAAIGRSLIESVRSADIQSLATKAVAGEAGAEEAIAVEVFGEQKPLFLLVRCAPIKGEESVRFLLIAADITQLKRIDQVRKDFVANVSHELKTPITAIKGFAETLLESPVGPQEQRRFLEIISAQSARLSNIIDDLLTLSRLDHATNPPALEPADIAAFAETVCDGFREKAAAKGIALVFSAEEGEGELAACINQALFGHALENVLDNAVKYCPEGGEVRCAVFARQEGGRRRIFVAVEDTGCGIPDECRERVFERFFRVDKGRSREQGGTGLGLAIARHVVELHGGTIRALGRADGKRGARLEIGV